MQKIKLFTKEIPYSSKWEYKWNYGKFKYLREYFVRLVKKIDEIVIVIFGLCYSYLIKEIK